MWNAKAKGTLLLYCRDEEFLAALQQIAQRNGYRLGVTHSLVEFVSRLLEDQCDVLVLDFRRVNAGTLSWLTMIHRLRPRLPMIVATDSITYELEKQIHQLMIFYLAFKPISDRILNEIIRAAVKFSRKQNPTLNTGGES